MGSLAISARRRRTRDPVLAAVARTGATTRAELSRLTGLSRSAVGECVAALLAEGVLIEGPIDGAAVGRGRRAATLRLRVAAGIVLGIDLGHAHVSAAVAARDGEVVAERTATLDVDRRPARALDLAAQLAAEVLDDGGHAPLDVSAVAAGLPGPLDVREHTVRAPTILTEWVGIDPAAELGARLGRPVLVGNDADMGAVGEQRFGAARGLDNFLYIKASHGIGAGIVIGGEIYRGATGIAGEIGHTQVIGANDLCRCGSRGCLETLVSVGIVRRQLVHVLSKSTAPLSEADIPPLPELAGNSAAARVIADAGRTVGRVVADLVTCLNPAAIVMGGELGAAGAPFIDGVRESVDRHAQPASAHAVQVISGRLGARAELRGTIATAAQEAARTALGS
ncbi:MAG TPA: ROK family protein [Jatrophihabitans sp.]|jgi:predicted NBD/HSP70 family sugar kinase|nr:ROK family protein [Jatrophihabitans sp.]